MKKIMFMMAMLTMVMAGCQNDEYDGLFNVDKEPETGVTFPDAKQGEITLMDDNAFIIKQNSVASGTIDVRIQNTFGKEIISVEPRAQRFRGTIAWPNLSPTVPTAAAQRAPSTFNRTIATLGKTEYSPASEVTYTLNVASLPVSLTNGTLTTVNAPATTGTPTYEVFRFFFLVTYSDGTSVLSNEVRVVVVG
jgi:hypothetical protein